MRTPHTVAVVHEFVLHNKQNRTLTDPIRNVPRISIAAGESGAQGDNLTIRGFTTRNDIFLDGIRDFANDYRDSFSYDQTTATDVKQTSVQRTGVCHSLLRQWRRCKSLLGQKGKRDSAGVRCPSSSFGHHDVQGIKTESTT